MIKYNLEKVYDWYDIKVAICEELDIKPYQFDKYHERVSGEYKSLMHVVVDYVIPHYQRDCIIPIYDYIDEYLTGTLILKYGDWVVPFGLAYNKVIKSISQSEEYGELKCWIYFD